MIAQHQLDDVIDVLKEMKKQQLKGNVTLVVFTQQQQQPSGFYITNSLSDEKFVQYDISAAQGYTKLSS